jgi:hypothetical protein
MERCRKPHPNIHEDCAAIGEQTRVESGRHAATMRLRLDGVKAESAP